MAFLDNLKKQMGRSKGEEKIKAQSFGSYSFSISLGVILVSFAIYFGFFFYGQFLQSDIDNAKGEIVTINADLKKIEEDNAEAQNFAERLSSLETILEEHSFWVSIFSEINSYIPKSVQFLNLNASKEKSQISVDAFTRTFTDISKTIVSLEELDIIEDVTVSDLSYNPRQVLASAPVSFRFTILLAPDAVNELPHLAPSDIDTSFNGNGGFGDDVSVTNNTNLPIGYQGEY